MEHVASVSGGGKRNVLPPFGGRDRVVPGRAGVTPVRGGGRLGDSKVDFLKRIFYLCIRKDLKKNNLVKSEKNNRPLVHTEFISALPHLKVLRPNQCHGMTITSTKTIAALMGGAASSPYKQQTRGRENNTWRLALAHGSQRSKSHMSQRYRTCPFICQFPVQPDRQPAPGATRCTLGNADSTPGRFLTKKNFPPQKVHRERRTKK